MFVLVFFSSSLTQTLKNVESPSLCTPSSADWKFHLRNMANYRGLILEHSDDMSAGYSALLSMTVIDQNYQKCPQKSMSTETSPDAWIIENLPHIITYIPSFQYKHKTRLVHSILCFYWKLSTPLSVLWYMFDTSYIHRYWYTRTCGGYSSIWRLLLTCYIAAGIDQES